MTKEKFIYLWNKMMASEKTIDLEANLIITANENIDLKLKLDKLTLDLKNVQRENNILRNVIQNPPKYENGETIGKYLITEVKIKDHNFNIHSFIKSKLHKNIFSIIMVGKPIFSQEEIELETKQNRGQYIYTVFDTDAKITKQIGEDELCNEKN